MRGVTLGLLVLLAACSGHGAGGLRGGQPGVDVADAALRGGSPEIALQVVGGILATDPDNKRALVIQGEALTQLGRLEEAGVSYTAALQRDPASVTAHIGLGRVRLASDPASAEALFLEALQRDPRNSVALNDLGIARDLQGRHGDAQTAYRQALAVDSNMAAAQVNLALSMAMSGQSRDAVQLLRPLASNPDASPKLRHDLAAVLTMAGQKEEATRILSADLTQGEVEQALTAYASAKSAGGPTTLVPGSIPALEPIATPPAAPPAAPPVQTEALTTRLPVTTSPSPAPAPAPDLSTTSVAEPAASPVKVEVPTTPPPITTDASPASTPAASPIPTDAAREAAAGAPTTAAATHTGGAVRVQLASVDSENGAKSEWQRLRKRMPDILDGRQPIIVKAEHDGRTIWRLRAGGFDDLGKASEFCDRVRAVGGDCITIR